MYVIKYNAVIFFQIMLVGCSSFVRDMLPKESTCDCDNLSIYLPDFKPRTIKNLLSILYTGENAASMF
jgi:hypothetical protein